MKINALNLTIENQTVTAEVLSKIVAGTEDIYTVTCFFDETWNGFAKTLILSNDCEYQFAILDQDGKAEIPRSVITPGRLYVGVYGVNAEGQKMTTRKNKSVAMVYDTDGNIELVPETFQQSQFDTLMSELADVRTIVAEQNTAMTTALQTIASNMLVIASLREAVRTDANQVASDKQYVANAKTHIDGVKTSVNGTLTEVNRKAGEVATNATKAETAKTQAQTSAGQALQSATNAGESADEALENKQGAEQAKQGAEQARDDAEGYVAEVETKRTQALRDIETKTDEQLERIPEVLELAEEVSSKMERVVLYLSNNGGTYNLRTADNTTVNFSTLYSLCRDESKYVVVLMGNSKLRPQYVSASEIHCDGEDRDSQGTMFLRMVMTANTLYYTSDRLADKSDVPYVDATLSINGAAAEATAVGQIKEDLSALGLTVADGMLCVKYEGE